MQHDDTAMLRARKIVEHHIERYGMVPAPDRLKEAIADAMRITVKVIERQPFIFPAD